jgi:hypothetical protein
MHNFITLQLLADLINFARQEEKHRSPTSEFFIASAFRLKAPRKSLRKGVSARNKNLERSNKSSAPSSRTLVLTAVGYFKFATLTEGLKATVSPMIKLGSRSKFHESH